MIGTLPNFYKDPHALANAKEREPILLALSGGADSVSLLHLLCETRKICPFPLYAAHVNHGIRGEKYGNEALRDEEFCRALCFELGVELFISNIDVPTIAKSSGLSLETAAREARYAFFAEKMVERSIRILATAHNADDNFETQLFNLCRGCGTQGICGIPETRNFDMVDGGIVVRPILSATKADILSFCDENSYKFVSDSTNFEDDCVRNKLRLNIIPQLKEIFNSPERAGLRLSAAAKEDLDLILSEAKGFLREQGGRIDLKELRRLHPAIAKRALMLSFEDISSAKLEQVHIEDLLSFAKSCKNGRISLPEGIYGVFEDGYLHFSLESEEKNEVSDYTVPLDFGINYISGTDFIVTLYGADQSEILPEGYELFDRAHLFADGSDLFARNRREGDKILSGGVHKKIKKLMCDKKVPTAQRNSLPLIFSGEKLIYAPLCAVSDGARADPKKFDFKISIYKKSNFQEI